MKSIIRLVLGLAIVAFAPLLTQADMGSYFQFIQPTTGTEWVNSQTNPVIWKKGLLDGVPMFDMELARLSQDGLHLLALNVNANSGSLNIFLQDLPVGDDYYLLFINSTHGGMHAISPRFSILASGSSVNASVSAEPAVASATTVSVSGAPNPTEVFITTFSPIAGAARPAASPFAGAMHGILGTVCALAAVGVSAAWLVL